MEYSFRDFVKILIKRWYILVVCAILAGLGAFLISEYNYVQTYTYSWQLRYMYSASEKGFDPSTDNLIDWSYNTNSANSINYFNATYMNIQHSEVFNWLAESVSENRKAGVYGYTVSRDYSASELKEMFNISTSAFNGTNGTSTNIPQGFAVSCTATDMSDAKIILELYCNLVKTKIKTLESPGEEEINYNKDVVVQIIPWDQTTFSQSSKSSVKNTVIATLIGIISGIIIICSIEIFDTHIHSEKELSDKFGIPILASIPNISLKKNNSATSKSKTVNETEPNVKS